MSLVGGSMKINSEEIYKNHNVHYIGHGQLESSAENFSTIHVISHEMNHVSEFKSEANKLGMDIADLNIHVHYELRNGKLVAVAGETEATYLPKKKDEIQDSYLSLFDLKLDIHEQKKEKTEKIENKLNEVESDLKTYVYGNFLANDSSSLDQFNFNHKKIHLKELKEKLELELEVLKFEELVKDLKDDLEEILSLNRNFSENLFKVGKASNLGQNLDLVI